MPSVPYYVGKRHIGFISTRDGVEELFALYKHSIYPSVESAIQAEGFRLVDFQRIRGDEETEYWYTYQRGVK
jgi:hypothetical protein